MSRGRGRGLPPRLCLVLAALVVVVVATSLAAMFHARVGDGTVGHARPHASAPASTPGERLPVVAPNAGSRSITDAERVRNLIVKRIDSAAHARYAQPELKPARYTHVVGEIARGYDLLVLHEATLDAATERCTEDPRCQGLSFAAAVPDTKRALEIVLKTSRIASPRGGYWSWIKPIAAAPAGARRAVGRITVAPGGSNAHASITGALQPREVALDVTLVTQTSVERLWMLKKLCDVWDGPVSAAVFVVGNQLADATAEMERSMCARKGHVAYLHGRHADNYPVNALRNKARQWVTTSHWMLTDVDLWPSMGAHATLLRLLREPWAAHRKVAIVLPAFATRHHDVNRMPANLESLARCIGRRECYCFKGYPGAIPAHHLTTNYPYWWHQTTRPAGESSVYKVPCFDTIVWEPYTLLPNARTTPLFDERFNGARTRAHHRRARCVVRGRRCAPRAARRAPS